MQAERDERSFGVSIKNGYDVGKSIALTGGLVALPALNVTPGTGVFLYNDTGTQIHFSVGLSSVVSFPLEDKTGITLYVDNTNAIGVTGAGTLKYIVNVYNDPSNIIPAPTN